MTRGNRAGTGPASAAGHASTPRRVGRAIRRTVMTVLSLAVVAVLALMLVGYHQHWETLVVLSGSMGRTDPVGSLVVGRPKPAEEVAVGDVILLRQTLPGKPLAPVLHRVIERTDTDGQITVRTKGDANDSPDPETHVLRGAIITPVVHVARLGYLLSFVRTPLGWLTVIVLPLLLVGMSGFAHRRPARKPSAGQSAGTPDPA